MNSILKNNFEDSIELCTKPYHNLCPFTLKCGTLNSVTIPFGTTPGTTFPLATVTLNTSCFCKPIVKLKFSSDINTTNLIGDINFQIFKLCTDQLRAIPVGSQFTFRRVGVATVAQPFTFFVCDCNTCFKGCCNYTVTVTSSIVTGAIDINAASLTAFAVETIEPFN
jgi:hypothetical protein